MSNIVPFESNTLPAYLMVPPSEKADNELGSSGGSFPVVSIKGKVFTIKRSGEATPVMKDGAPAPFIDVVILKVFPIKADNAKVYYASAYVEGSDAKPDCYSNDGKTPSEHAANKQSPSCVLCPHNQWGSRVTNDGKKGKMCQDSKRLAIAAPGLLNDPMMLRVPATSLAALAGYGDLVAKRRAKYYGVLTRIGFDYTKAHPQLTFSPIGFIDQASMAEAEEMRESSVIAEICGVAEPAPQDTSAPAPTPAPAPAPAKAAAPASKGKAKAAIDAMVADVKPAAPVPEPETPVMEIDDDEDLAGAIDMLDNDD